MGSGSREGIAVLVMTTKDWEKPLYMKGRIKKEQLVEKSSLTKLKYIQGNDKVVVKFDRGK